MEFDVQTKLKMIIQDLVELNPTFSKQEIVEFLMGDGTNLNLPYKESDIEEAWNYMITHQIVGRWYYNNFDRSIVKIIDLVSADGKRNYKVIGVNELEEPTLLSVVTSFPVSVILERISNGQFSEITNQVVLFGLNQMVELNRTYTDTYHKLIDLKENMFYQVQNKITLI